MLVDRFVEVVLDSFLHLFVVATNISIIDALFW